MYIYIYKWTLLTLTIPISQPSPHSRKVANKSLQSLITEAPSTAALALLSGTSILRGATAPIRCYESIQTLARATDCKRDCRVVECEQGALFLTSIFSGI
ncbi:hypothetical protein MFRU_017g01570 [Monilinia fructicola]|nr:hypothetical protein MFRU_017g01570 [Monilinia fructicola]